MYRESADKEIAGSPFFLDEWSPGIIYMRDGSKAEKFLLKLDILRNELIFLHEGRILSVVNSVKEFVLNTNSGNRFLFRCGYPEYERYDAGTYYQVISDGPYSFLKMNRKSVVESTAFNQGTKKEYVVNETYFIASPAQLLTKIKREKRSVLEALGDTDGKLAAWINKNGLRCKTEADIAAVVKVFNEGSYK